YPSGMPVTKTVPGFARAPSEAASAENRTWILPAEVRVKPALRNCPTVEVGKVMMKCAAFESACVWKLMKAPVRDSKTWLESGGRIFFAPSAVVRRESEK